ncbi:TetR/AcrR family transcriptional regulator [Methylobacterium segetis]|uniref:TetR/AcrR family transcriptional regulator n=1 Tax=Methylobacterium segetis TaxID=2488750 RepID=UPI00104C7D1E|nr:TetR/AcrR family transcriptional regulator [Methylobacterium segetis]
MRDTRAELLAEAETLVRGRGYSGFSYADLSAAVGIRKASIHHHFRTKEDLGFALMQAYEARYETALDAILAENPDAVARIEAYGRLYLGGVEQGLGCLCAALATEGEALPARLREAVVTFFDRHIAWLERVLRQGQAEGSVRAGLDTAAQARFVISTLEGALLMERLLGGPPAFSATLRALCASLR